MPKTKSHGLAKNTFHPDRSPQVESDPRVDEIMKQFAFNQKREPKFRRPEGPVPDVKFQLNKSPVKVGPKAPDPYYQRRTNTARDPRRGKFTRGRSS